MFYVLVKLYLQNPTLFLLVKTVRNFDKSQETQEQKVIQVPQNMKITSSKTLLLHYHFGHTMTHDDIN